MTSTHARTRLASARQYTERAEDLLALRRRFTAPPPGSGLRRIPGDPGKPIVGNGVGFLRNPNQFARQRYQRYGPVSWMSGAGQRAVLLLGPDAAETVLVNREKAFANGPGWEVVAGPFIRRGIMLLDFDEHVYHRRIMQQAFNKPRLQGYLRSMNEVIDGGIRHWQPGEDFLALPAFKGLALDLAARTFLGTELGPKADEINQAFLDLVGAASALVRFNMPGGRWHRALVARRALENFAAEMLPAKRAQDGEDLFSALCHATDEDGERFTDSDVIDHILFTLFAAHDTTNITMNTMCYQLAKHPQWQDRVRAESLALGKDQLEFDDLDKLVSLDLVMKEALRLIAPVPVLARKTVKDTEVLGHYLPRDTFCIVQPMFTHMMPEYWPNPERFDPERFADHRREDKVHRYAWMPFGGGAHKCIGMHFGGMEVKAIFHQVLQRFRWSVEPGYQTTYDYTRLPVPADGLPVRLERI